MNRIVKNGLIALLASTVVACAGDSPDAAAKSWLQAIASNDGNTIGLLTCGQEQGSTQLGMGFLAALNILGQGVIGQAAQIDASGAQFTTVQQTATDATVHLGGQLRVAVLTLWQNQPLNSNLHMRLEDGRWKYCGGT